MLHHLHNQLIKLLEIDRSMLKISLKAATKSSGPKIEPWRMPVVTVALEKRHHPFLQTVLDLIDSLETTLRRARNA